MPLAIQLFPNLDGIEDIFADSGLMVMISMCLFGCTLVVAVSVHAVVDWYRSPTARAIRRARHRKGGRLAR